MNTILCWFRHWNKLFGCFQQHVENLRAWNRDREAELAHQYEQFLKESRIKELEKVSLSSQDLTAFEWLKAHSH